MFDRILCSVSRRLGKFPGAERIANAFVSQTGFSPERIELLDLGGFQMRVCPRSRVGWNLFVFGCYDPQLQRIMKRLITPGSVVLDVGANIGWHTLFAARLAGTAGTVHAFEPNPYVRAELQLNISSNGLDNVKVWDTALSNANGTALFNAPQVSSLAAGDGSLRVPLAESELSSRIDVKTCQLDTMDLGLARLDFIKIDVEGHEAAVFEGAIKTIGQFRPVIAFEYISGDLTDAITISRLLSSMDYHFYGYNDRQVPRPIFDLGQYSGDVLATPEQTSW
jgi:FkbM family methyltransferase